MENILEVKNLYKNFKEFLLENISFEIPKGTIMGLIGENGAGKSTTIKCVLDLMKKDKGSVYFLGEEYSIKKTNLKEYIGVVFDDINFYKTLNIKQIENISKKTFKNWDTEKFYQYMSNFKLPLNKEINTFSKGMKMKLSIAIALSHDVKLLILDEATIGLDPVMRDDILEIFLEFVKDGERSILISSHITTDLEKIADYIMFIHNGKVIFSIPKEELYDKYGILKITKEEFETINKKDIIAFREFNSKMELLIKNKDYFANKYNFKILDIRIDDVLLLFVKGEVINESFDN